MLTAVVDCGEGVAEVVAVHQRSVRERLAGVKLESSCLVVTTARCVPLGITSLII